MVSLLLRDTPDLTMVCRVAEPCPGSGGEQGMSQKAKSRADPNGRLPFLFPIHAKVRH